MKTTIKFQVDGLIISNEHETMHESKCLLNTHLKSCVYSMHSKL